MIIYGDDLLQFYFWTKHFTWAISHWSLQDLLWSPWNFLGQPFLFNLQYGALNPLMWLSLPLGVVGYINSSYIISIVVALLGQYLFMRRHFQLSVWASLTAGIVFALNGFVFPRIYAGHINVITTFCWLPLIFFFQTEFLKTRKSRWAVLWVLGNYLQLTGGFVTLFMLSAFVQILWLIWTLFLVKFLPTVNFKHLIKSFLPAIIVAILTILPVLIIFSEVLSESQRSIKKDYSFSSSYSLPLKNLVTAINPEQYGNPIYRDSRLFHLGYQGKFNYWEISFFFGTAGLILVMLSLWHKSPHRYFFLVILVGGIILSLGNATPFFKLVFDHLPFYRFIRIPAHHLYLVIFSAAILVGLGFDVLNQQRGKLLYLLLITICGLSLMSSLNLITISQRVVSADNTPLAYENDFGDLHVRKTGSVGGFTGLTNLAGDTPVQLTDTQGWQITGTSLETTSTQSGILKFHYQTGKLGISELSLAAIINTPDGQISIEESSDNQNWNKLKIIDFKSELDAIPTQLISTSFWKSSHSDHFIRITGNTSSDSKVVIDRISLISY